MTKPRSRRSDSATSAVVAAQNAALGTLLPPPYIALPDAAMPFWEAIMRNRPRDTWNAADLAHAAVLARTQSDVERLLCEVEREGDMVDGAINPKVLLLEKVERRALSLARFLHVHPEATQGRARENGNKLELEREAASDADPLIPVLRVVS